jgi:putative membrane protein
MFMLIEIIIALALGIISGTFTGLIPGIHVNLVSVSVVGVSGFVLSYVSPLSVAVFIVAMAVTHTFLDAIPSIFLGMPSDDMALAVMPGHRLLIKGMGHEAVKMTVIGSLLCLISAVLIAPLLAIVFPIIYAKTRGYISLILVIVAIVMLSREKGLNKLFWACVVFAFAGILGMIVWVSEINQPLFPLLSGLFGLSTIIMSLSRNVEVPLQRITYELKPSKWAILGAVAAGTISGSFTALFPGIGASQAAVIATSLYMKTEEYVYLIIVGGVNTVNFVVGIVTFYTLDKARNGGVVAVMDVLGRIDAKTALLFISVALIAGGISAVLALKFSIILAGIIGKVNYPRICVILIVFITALATIISGPLGLFVLIVSAAIGIMPHLVNVGKRHCMGCLLLPVIVYFL